MTHRERDCARTIRYCLHVWRFCEEARNAVASPELMPSWNNVSVESLVRMRPGCLAAAAAPQ